MKQSRVCIIERNTFYVRIQKRRNAWIDSRVRKLIKAKNRMHKRHLRNPDSRTEIRLAKFAKYIKSVIEKTKTKYYNYKIGKCNAGTMWTLVKEITGGGRKIHKIDKINVQGTIITESQDIADQFSEHYCLNEEQKRTSRYASKGQLLGRFTKKEN